MKTWTLRDAQSRLDELLDACLAHGPQLITRQGVETAVAMSMAEWQRLNARPSLKQLLLSEFGRGELNVPPRGQARWRADCGQCADTGQC